MMTKNDATIKNDAARRGRPLALTAAVLAALFPLASPARAAGPERSLAGVAIFDSGSVVTRKFGNPSRILVGGVGAAVGGANGSAGSSGSSSGYPGSSSSSSGGYPGSSSGTAGAGLLPGFPGVPTGGQGSLSGEFPGSQGGSPGGFSGSSGGFSGSSSGILGGIAAVPIKPPVTLVYDRAKGGSLEFTVSPDKRVIQIRETGYSGSYGTARGIRLGTTYSAVVARYGYPENTSIAGPIINIDYKDTLHCGFQFLDQKLVGIIVASPD